MDLTESIAPRSDQLNAEDFLTGPRTVTITEVSSGNAEQPVNVHVAEFPDRPFKPSKSMRRVMVAAWGKESAAYAGKRMTLYRDPTVRFGGQDVGGIRISHMSHLDKRLTLALTVTRGKRAPYVVEPLPDGPADGKPLEQRITEMVGAFDGIGVTVEQLEQRFGKKRGKWTAQDVAAAGVVFGSIKRGDAHVADEFAAAADTTPAADPVDAATESWPTPAAIPGGDQ